MTNAPGGKARPGQRIEKLYAWVAEEPDGGEGILGSDLPGLGYVPLIGADRARIESYRSIAQAMGDKTGYPIRLKLFAAGTVIDEIKRR